MSELVEHNGNGNAQNGGNGVKRTGRPTKFNKDIAEKIIRLIRSGNYIHIAAAAAGICRDTLNHWIRKGSQSQSGQLKEFSDAVQGAVAEAESLHVEKIVGASDEGKWQAAAWMLERKHGERWGRTDRHQHTGYDGGAIKTETKINITLSKVVDEYTQSFGRLRTGMCQITQDDGS